MSAGRAGEDVVAEGAQTGLSRVAQVGQLEVALHRAQEGVVVVLLPGDRAGLDAGRDHHGADPPASRPWGQEARGVGWHDAGPWLLVAAPARVRIRPGRLGLVEGHDQKPAVLERGGVKDHRHLLAEPAIGGDEPARISVRARSIVAVMAQAGDDEGVAGGGPSVLEVLPQVREVDVVVPAGPPEVDERVEVHERVVAGGVLVRGLGALPRVALPDRWVAARRLLALGGVGVHVLHVAPPLVAGVPQLIADVLDARRIDATGAEDLAVARRRARD